MQTIVGLDIGRSSVKIVVIGDRYFEHSFPTAVVPIDSLQPEDRAELTDDSIVTVGSIPYCAGKMAVKYDGYNPEFMHDDWFNSPRYEALFRAAIRTVEASGLRTDTLSIVLSLPARVRREHESVLEALHAKVCPQASFHLLTTEDALFYSQTLDNEGARAEGDPEQIESLAFINVGLVNTVFSLYKDGQWIQRASGQCAGMVYFFSKLKDDLRKRGIARTIREIDGIIRKGRNANGKWIQTFLSRDIDVSDDTDSGLGRLAADITRHAQSLLKDDASDLNRIIVTGGGAPLVFPLIKGLWPNISMNENPVYAVAIGCARYGQQKLASLASTKKDENDFVRLQFRVYKKKEPALYDFLQGMSSSSANRLVWFLLDSYMRQQQKTR